VGLRKTEASGKVKGGAKWIIFTISAGLLTKYKYTVLSQYSNRGLWAD